LHYSEKSKRNQNVQIIRLNLLLCFLSVALTTGIVISGFSFIAFLFIVFHSLYLPRAKALVEELSLLALKFR